MGGAEKFTKKDQVGSGQEPQDRWEIRILGRPNVPKGRTTGGRDMCGFRLAVALSLGHWEG